MTTDPEPIVSKPIADFGDMVAETIRDSVRQESDERLRAALYAAIERGDFIVERHPGDPRVPMDRGIQVIRFPALRREYVIPLVKVGQARWSDA